MPTFASLQPAGLVAPKRTAAAERAQQMNISGQQRTAALQSQAAADLQNRLNQMTDMAFQAGAAQAKVEGAAYGVQNAPSADLIKNADTSEWEIDARGQPVPGDTWTVFGRHARNAALQQMNLELSEKAQTEMRGITAAAYDQFGVPIKAPTDVENELNKLVDDTKNAAMQISPVLASKLYANLRIDGHNALKAFNTKYLTHQGKRLKVLSERGVVVAKKLAAVAIANGDYGEANRQYLVAQTHVVNSNLPFGPFAAGWKKHIQDTIVAETGNLAADIGIKKVLDHFYAKNTFDDFVGGSTEQAKRLQNAWGHMDKTTRGKFVSSLNAAFTARNTKQSTAAAMAERKETLRLLSLAGDLGKTDDIVDQEVRAQERDKIFARMGSSPAARALMKALESEIELPRDIRDLLDLKIATNTLKAEYVEQFISDGILKGKAAIHYAKAVAEQTSQSAALKLAVDHVATTLKIVPTGMFQAGTKDRDALLVYLKLRTLLTRWHSKGVIGDDGKRYGLNVGGAVDDGNIEDIAAAVIESKTYQDGQEKAAKSAVNALKKATNSVNWSQRPSNLPPDEWVEILLAGKEKSFSLSGVLSGAPLVEHYSIEDEARDKLRNFIARYRDLKKQYEDSDIDAFFGKGK